MVFAGDLAPSFQLVDHVGRFITERDLAGNWYLLYWYPRADTPGCTAQAQGLRDQIEAFEELRCRVLGASFDRPATNAAFRERYSLPFALLSDPTHDVAVAFGAAENREAKSPQRIAHLVNPDGVVVQVYDVDDPSFFAESVLDDLEDHLVNGARGSE